MVKFRLLAIIGALSLAGCNNAGLDPGVPGPTGPAPAGSGTAVNRAAAVQAVVETPNSMPSGETADEPAIDNGGVLGVRHLPP